MQVKDLIKELTDEKKVKVEKIGSGNWFWCWAGEEAREKKLAIAQLESVEIFHSRSTPHTLTRALRVEKRKLDASNASVHGRVQTLREEQAAAQGDCVRQGFLDQLGPLEEEVKTLAAEKDGWENAIAGGVEGIRVDTMALKSEVAELTDNIYILEAHIQSLVNDDRETMDLVRRDCYGAYFVEEEGLPEIEGL
jgi:Mnd1 HTH domain